MSNLNSLYSIYDRQAQYYLPPFASRSDAEAERTFTEAVVAGDTHIAHYPHDFDLVLIGTFDLDSGLVVPRPMPQLLLNGLVALQAAQRTRQRYQEAVKAGSFAVSGGEGDEPQHDFNGA